MATLPMVGMPLCVMPPLKGTDTPPPGLPQLASWSLDIRECDARKHNVRERVMSEITMSERG